MKLPCTVPDVEDAVAVVETAIVLALSAFYLTRLIRILPVFGDWTTSGIKPFSCNTCMSFWATMVSFGALYLIGHEVQVESAAAGFGLCLILLDLVGPQVAPIELPTAEKSKNVHPDH